MDGMEIFKQDVCRATIECNANLVVVYNGKKAFWYYEHLQALVAEYPNKSITLLEFCVAAEKVGDKCSKETTKCSFCFVARNVPLGILKEKERSRIKDSAISSASFFFFITL